MKRFLGRLALLGALAYALMLAIDVAFSSYVKGFPTLENTQWQDILSREIVADVVICGDSRASGQVDPAVLDSILGCDSYNIGTVGRCGNSQVIKYDLFSKLNASPKLVLQQFDCNTLQRSFRDYDIETFFPYFWNKDFYRVVVKGEAFTLADRILPLWRYEGLRPAVFRQYTKYRPAPYRGYQPTPKEWRTIPFENSGSYRDTVRFGVDDVTLRLFREFLAKTASEGVKVVFFYPPIPAPVLGNMENEEEMKEFISGLAEPYGIPILDFTRLQMCSDTSLFHDAAHLNDVGARMFSDSLARAVKDLGYL